MIFHYFLIDDVSRGINEISENSEPDYQEFDQNYEGLYFWELPERFENLGFTEEDCDLVLQGANDDIGDWKNISLDN